jgi:hypothetical protein
MILINTIRTETNELTHRENALERLALKPLH